MKKILIVEDSPEVRRDIRECFGQNPNYEMFEAASGREGYSLLSQDPRRFDLILLDYHLPGMTGIEILRQLVQEGRPVTCPVVMITSEVEVKGSEVKDLNIMSWVVKPFSKPRLEQLVAQIFAFVS